MSRLFDDAAQQYLEYAGAPITGVPLTMACFFNTNDNTIDQDMMTIGNNTVAYEGFRLSAAGAISGDRLRAYSQKTGSAFAAATTVGWSPNVLHHACGVWGASNSRIALLDGNLATSGSNSSTSTPVGLNRTTIGSFTGGTAGSPGSARTTFFSGMIAEAAIWNIALSAEEIAALAKGFCPLLIRPANLVGYWPLIGRNSPEIDRKSGFDMTVTGATAADHCRIIMPKKRIIRSFTRRFKPAWAVNANTTIQPGVIAA